MAAPRSYAYNADPQFSDIPLHLDEVQAMRAAKDAGGLTKDGRKLKHFLSRVEATLVLAEERERSFARDIASMRAAHERSGAPSTLSPLDVLRFASPEQQAAACGQLVQDKIARLNAEAAAATAARQGAEAAAATARSVLARVAEMVDDPAARAEIAALAASLAATAPAAPAAAPGAGAGWGPPAATPTASPAGAAPAAPAAPTPAAPPAAAPPAPAGVWAPPSLPVPNGDPQ